ncbi:MAG: tetratricopeptide repeat protein [Janthinobacterium lividum]
MTSINLFISTVSNEFRNYRNELQHYLTRHNVAVKIQEDFNASGVETLHHLATYVEHCDAVVHLVGNQTGHPINKSSQDWLQTHYPTLAIDFPALREVLDGTITASYTQWEAYLALVHRKRLFVAMPTDEAPRDNDSAEITAPVQNQEKHLKRVRTLGRYPEIIFRNADQLVAQLAVSGLNDLLLKASAPVQPQNLPYTTLGPLLKGRGSLLNELRNKLLDTKSGSYKALYGLGGIGKTRLAVEYAWQHQQDYSALLFVPADTSATLEANLASLAPILNIVGQNAQEQDIRLRAVLDWLDQHPKWLLILDNLDTPEAAAAAEKWLPQLTTGHVLLTTRVSEWSSQVESLELDVLQEADAVDFLLERTPHRRIAPTDAADALALVRILGRLALALEQAGAYVDTKRIVTLRTYHERWITNQLAVREWCNARLMHYPLSVAVTWQTSFDQLSIDARTLLNCLAWLAPAPIPLTLLDVAVPNVEQIAIEEALGELARYSLVRYTAGGQAFIVHQLVQEVTRTWLRGETRQQTFISTLEWLNDAFVGDAQDVLTWFALEPLLPHALAVAYDVAPEFGNPEPTNNLASSLGQLLNAKAKLSDAEALMRRSLAIAEQKYGSAQPEIAVYLNNLASVLRASNRLEEAESLFRRALAINEQSYDPDHPTVAISLNNLAALLQTINQPEEAETLLRQALTIDEKNYGSDHPTVAIRLNNLASVLLTINRPGEAEPLYRRALAINERSYGPDHPNVAVDLNNLAGLLRNTNRLKDAELLFRRALSIDEKSYDHDHPTVAMSLNNLAGLLQSINRSKEAEPLYRRALAIVEQNYDLDHPRVANSLNNLAGSLQNTNRPEEAEPLYRRALAIDEKNYGSDHPTVAIRLNNLASLLQTINQLKEAEPLYRRALVITERSYGPNHPNVAIRLNNLAGLLQATNRLDEAEPLFRQCLINLIIDYRRTGHPHNNFQDIIKNYMKLLRQLDHSDLHIKDSLESLGIKLQGNQDASHPD